MPKRIFIWSVALILLMVGDGLLTSAAAESARVSHVWFTPSLSVNADAHCDSMLSGARQKFMTSRVWEDRSGILGDQFNGFTRIQAPTEEEPGADETLKVSSDDPHQLIFSVPHKDPAYISFAVNPGCGGACDTETVVVSSQADSGDAATFSTPLAISWTIYKSAEGEHYLLGVVDHHLEAYRVTSPSESKLSCSVAFAPDFEKNADTAVQDASKAVSAFKTVSKGLSRAGGYCGSLAADYQLEASIAEALQQTLYRPWVLVAEEAAAQGDDSYSNYSKILSNLEKWSLSGLSERTAFLRYKDQLARATKALAAFYELKFAQPEPQAERMAEGALKGAIGHGFIFGDYDPFPHAGEAELRKAILDHRPMSEIEAITFDGAQLDEAGADSILNVAVTYPEALRYLLNKPLNPNQANPFGKTPLMYAAQYNQIESARLLLAAGADPNARTIAPADTCEYAIKTTNMTPLHYAVRYASAGMVRLLTGNGAVSFIKAHGSKPSGEAPLDWLQRYTSRQPDVEPNHFIETDDASKLAKLLRIPDDAELSKIGATQVARAEALYVKGEIEAAYRLTSLALEADPNNQKALSDRPLLALKKGTVGEAAEAASKAIERSASGPAQAAAWFNLGLACEQAAKGIEYNGTYYCDGDRINPYFRAWQIGPNASRGKKLADLLAKTGRDVCASQGRTYHFAFSPAFTRMDHHDHAVQRVYVLHRPDENIDPASIEWNVAGSGTQKAMVERPHAVGTFILGDAAVTLLEADHAARGPFIDGHLCAYPN